MSRKIALVGNPNSGKTTLFNLLTGSNQRVGNWPGVTVEQKIGTYRLDSSVEIVDLPGVYSLSPYSLEEVVTRDYVISERPDAIIDIVDGTNLERNLYLTLQVLEMGIPTVVAINMVDVVERQGDLIEIEKLSERLGCPVVKISALRGEGIEEAMAVVATTAETGIPPRPQSHFSQDVETTIASIGARLDSQVPEAQRRFFAIKIFERDVKIDTILREIPDVEEEIASLERIRDDVAEGIIASERYGCVDVIVAECYVNAHAGELTLSDKIDLVVTNRWLGLPIFAVVMFLIYFISVTTVGSWTTAWANDGVFGAGWFLGGAPQTYITAVAAATAVDPSGAVAATIDPSGYGLWIPGIPALATQGLTAIGCADWLQDLIVNGIISGVGAVLGFVPQLLVLFFLLALLEGCGYMSRIAFLLDRVFRRFGLSGKSFIPILVGTGCGVPGIMASRTIEDISDRRMTIMTTTFIPCSAKLPIIALIAGAVFGGVWWVAPSAYFLGIAAILCSGIILKKTAAFSSATAPFVMELPAYRPPDPKSVARSVSERVVSFVAKAGTIILLAAVIIWFISGYGFEGGSFGAVLNPDDSLLAIAGGLISWLFVPLGWGSWQAVATVVTGLLAKENIVSTLAVLYAGGSGWYANLQSVFSVASGYSFLAFNLLCAPCFAAMSTIRKEMGDRRWFWAAIGYQCGLAYGVALVIYQLAGLAIGELSVGPFTFVAGALVAIFIYLLVRPNRAHRTIRRG
jgi:ferrous iron transport protein B